MKNKLIYIFTALLIVAGIGLAIRSVYGPAPSYDQLAFAYGQVPTFEVQAKDISPEDIYVRDKKNRLVKVEAETHETENGTEIKVSPKGTYKPGVYTMHVRGTQIKQDFTWGVLAINTNKDTFAPREEARIAIAVLDQEGGMVCNADVKLEIVSPNGRTTTLSTDNGRVKANPECKMKTLVERDDYEASFRTGGEGIYTMYLTATTPHQGEYTIRDSFEVRADSPFYITRDTRTRIYPPLDYPVEITVKATKDFKGKIVETVPASFGIVETNASQVLPTREAADLSVGDFGEIITEPHDPYNIYNLQNTGETKSLIWDVDIKKGKEITLSYKYDAPDISPYFHTLGELRFYKEGCSPSNVEGARGSTCVVHTEHRKFHIASDDIKTMRPNADNADGAWTAATGSDLFEMINDDPDSPTDTSDYIIGPNVTDQATYTTFIEIGPLPAGFGSANSVDIKVRHQENGDGSGAGDDTINMHYRLYEADKTTALTAESSSTAITQGSWDDVTYSSVSITGTNDADTWDGAVLAVRSQWVKSQGTDTTSRAWVSAVEININYDPEILVQDAYIFENDDGANVNSNTDIASANTEIEHIKKGERFVARIQIANESTSTLAKTYKLQYDRNDGNWSDVDFGGRPSSYSSDVTLTQVVTSSDLDGSGSSMAIGADGLPIVSHLNTTGNDELRITKCYDVDCTNNTTAETVNADIVGYNSDIAIGTDGLPIIVHNVLTLNDLIVTKCHNLDCSSETSTKYVNYEQTNKSIAIGSDGYPVIAGYDDSANNAKVVKCSNLDCSSNSETTITDAGGDDIGWYMDMTIASDGYPILAYRNGTDGVLVVKKCSSLDCSTVSNTTEIGDPNAGGDSIAFFNSIAIGTDGYPVIAHNNFTDDELIVTKCSNLDCSSNSSYQIPFDELMSERLKLVIGRDGLPIIVTENSTDNQIVVIKCLSNDCREYNIDQITETSTSQQFLSAAIGMDGQLIINYHNYPSVGDLMFLKYNLGTTEITPSLALSGANGDALTAQAAGTCQTTSSANGEFREATTSAYLSLANDTCTELAFSLETSEATPGQTYRLRVVESNDAALYRYDQYPTFKVVDNNPIPTLFDSLYNIESNRNDNKRYSKEAVLTTGDCNDTGWECNQLSHADNVGEYTSIAIGSDGLPIISHQNVTDSDLMITKCNDFFCTSNLTTQITDADDVGLETSIAIGVDGLPIISHQNVTDSDLMITKCNNLSCTSSSTTQITNASDVGEWSSIAIGTDGLPIISYEHVTNSELSVTKCNDIACSGNDETTTQITYNTDSIGAYTSIAIGSDGLPIISHRNFTDAQLLITKCNDTACSGNDETTTQITYNTDSIGRDSAIAIGADGYPVIAYHNLTANPDSLMVTKCNNDACTSSTTTEITHATDNIGTRIGIAIGIDGLPIISHLNFDDFDLMITKCNDTACSGNDETTTQITNANHIGQSTSIAIGSDGLPLIAQYYSDVSGDLFMTKQVNIPTVGPAWFDSAQTKQLKYHQEEATPSAQFLYASPLLEDGMQYWLDNKGYSDIAQDDSNMDPITSASTETPVFSFIDKHASNTDLPSVVWIGQSTVAASTNNLHLQIYRFGTTNAWETVETNSTCGANTDCVIDVDTDAYATTTASDYYFYRPEYDPNQNYPNGAYWTYWRVYQDEGAQTLKTDLWQPKNEMINVEGVNFEGINFW